MKPDCRLPRLSPAVYGCEAPRVPPTAIALRARTRRSACWSNHTVWRVSGAVHLRSYSTSWINKSKDAQVFCELGESFAWQTCIDPQVRLRTLAVDSGARVDCRASRPVIGATVNQVC